MSKEKKAKSGDFRDTLTARRAEAALNELNKAFAVERADDSDEQLLEYLRHCAEEIGHSPNSCEVIGGLYIAARFGGWQKAISLAGLRPPKTAPKWENRLIVRRERNRQWELFLKEKQETRQQKEKMASIK